MKNIIILIVVITLYLTQVFIMASLWKISDNCGNDYQTLRSTISELKSENIQKTQVIKNQSEMITEMADSCYFK